MDPNIIIEDFEDYDSGHWKYFIRKNIERHCKKGYKLSNISHSYYYDNERRRKVSVILIFEEEK